MKGYNKKISEYSYRVLKIYINEKEHYEGKPLHEWIIHKAQEKNILAATVIRGMEGIDTKHKLHSIKLLTLSIDLPLKIEIIDTRDKIKDFHNIMNGILEEGIITVEKIKAQVFSRNE